MSLEQTTTTATTNNTIANTIDIHTHARTRTHTQRPRDTKCGLSFTSFSQFSSAERNGSRRGPTPTVSEFCVCVLRVCVNSARSLSPTTAVPGFPFRCYFFHWRFCTRQRFRSALVLLSYSFVSENREIDRVKIKSRVRVCVNRGGCIPN